MGNRITLLTGGSVEQRRQSFKEVGEGGRIRDFLKTGGWRAGWGRRGCGPTGRPARIHLTRFLALACARMRPACQGQSTHELNNPPRSTLQTSGVTNLPQLISMLRKKAADTAVAVAGGPAAPGAEAASSAPAPAAAAPAAAGAGGDDSDAAAIDTVEEVHALLQAEIVAMSNVFDGRCVMCWVLTCVWGGDWGASSRGRRLQAPRAAVSALLPTTPTLTTSPARRLAAA